MRHVGGRLLNKSDLRAFILGACAVAAMGALGACSSLDSTLEGARGLLGPSAEPPPAATAESSNAAASAPASQAETPPPAEPLKQKPGGPIIARQSEEQPGAAESSSAPAVPSAPAAPSANEPAPARASAATTEPAAAEKPAPAPPAEQAVAANPPSATPPAAAEGEGGSKETAEAQAGGQASGEPGPDGRRVVSVPKGGGAGADLKRRLDSLIGGSASTSAIIDTKVKEADIVGNWVLDEEDGLRTCVVTLASPDKGAAVTAGEGCSGLAAEVTGWGMFGTDLLLRDANNTVRARLRQSEGGWLGFTLESGIPLSMSRAG